MFAYLAIGLAALVGGVPASLAQDSGVLDQCKPAGTGAEAEERQMPISSGGNAGVSVVLPLGRVCVGPKALDGEYTYVRRTADKGITIVEVSNTPFVAVLASNDVAGQLIARPDQPAGW